MLLTNLIRFVSYLALLSLLIGCATTVPTLKLNNRVIDDAVVWSGKVLVEGVVTVKKTGQLTIEPGTHVYFVPKDADGDGIGDAELLVEGTLIAHGTAAAPIVFTSAAKQPKPSDWKYLYLDFARKAELDYVISEYAYSGLQIHFCRARVTNSTFRHNVDGLRFSTVNLLAAGNSIYNNRHGLRYEERNGEAFVHHNEIRDNDIGLFVVTRSEDKTRIEQNNITGNRQYNVKLGWQQPGAVTLPHNWWGTKDQAIINETFLDKKVDARLGLVTAPEPLAGPVQTSAWQQPE